MPRPDQVQRRRWKALGCGWLVWLLAGLLGLLILAAVLWPAFAPARHHGPSRCTLNLRALGDALVMYATDHAERLPVAAQWSSDLRPYVKRRKALTCPSDRSRSSLSYTMRCDLSGVARTEVADCAQTAVLCDGINGLVIERHNGGANYAFVDGHVKWLAEPPEGLQPMQVIER